MGYCPPLLLGFVFGIGMVLDCRFVLLICFLETVQDTAKSDYEALYERGHRREAYRWFSR